MNLLILRCAESSLSYRLMQQARGSAVVRGQIRRIGGDGEHSYVYPRGRGEGITRASTFAEALARVGDLLADVDVGSSEGPPVEATAHLFFTGGRSSVPVARVDDELLAQLSAGGGAPANRKAFEVLGAVQERYPDAKHVAVWDDAFFSELPPESRGYLLPDAPALAHDLRRRGYRGLLHAAAVGRVAPDVARREPERRSGGGGSGSNPPTVPPRVVVCFFDRHAGVTAVRGGAPVWTTFGMAPGDGLPGERGVGTIDVGALEALLLDADLPREVLLKALRTSGGLGLREDEDLDRIALEAARGQEPARTTFETFVQVVAVAIGGAATVLGGIDALVFIGSHAVSSHRFREAVCGRLGVFGVAAPADVPVPPFEVTRLSGLTDTGPAVFAAPVNEDELVAREVIRLLLGVRGRDDEAASRRSEP